MSSSSYRTALKSTSVIGGAALITILIGMVRTKFVAVLLGPYGVGLMGVYSTIITSVSTISSMGTDTSGVRKIAEAHGEGDQIKISRLVNTLLRVAWFTGALGMLAMMVGSGMLSRVALGTREHEIAIAVLGVAVLLGNVTIGQTCLLQGTRRIGVMAKGNVIGALLGLLLSVPCFYFWGIQGIVPGLILVALAALVAMWWFAHLVDVVQVKVPWRETKTAALDLLHFGLPVMGSGIVIACSAYLVRALLVRQVGLEGVGIWQTAFNLSGVLVNFVLGAIITDYYPKLITVVNDDRRVCDEVNAQTEIAMFLAVPGLMATIIFAPLAVMVFYSGKFDAAVDVLRWFACGILCRIMSWPMGLVVLAKGKGKTFFVMETISNGFYIAVLWFCCGFWGLKGAGLAFLLYHLFNAIMTCVVVGVISHAKWTHRNVIYIFSFSLAVAAVAMISGFVVLNWLRNLLNLSLLCAVTFYCMRHLAKKSGVTLAMLRSRITGEGRELFP